MLNRKGVLLVNLGTPNSPRPRDVYRYLIEFLTDERVIDLPWLKRQLLVRGLIVPTRYRQSAKAYQHIWTEKGSPLLVYGRRVQHLLQETLGEEFRVELGMRYQKPSIKQAIASLLKLEINHLIVVPLFPQYASASTGSVLQCVQEVMSKYNVIPKMTLINHYATHPRMIDAFHAVANTYDLSEYDHVLFSFHGLPERHLRKADCTGNCLNMKNCCQMLTLENRNCYSAQCHATAFAIAERLKIPHEKFTICFQSRLGKDPWIQPYTSLLVNQLPKAGKKKVLVFCPSFVCDCLETTYEIGVEYAQEFKHAGGERLDLVPGLNDHPAWIQALKALISEGIGEINP